MAALNPNPPPRNDPPALGAPGRWVWRLLPSVRRTERERFRFFAGLYALLTLGQTMGLAGSESLFLERLGAEGLPAAFVLAAGLCVVASLGYAFLVARLRNDRMFEGLLVGSGVLLAAAATGLGENDAPLRIALFCAFYVIQVVSLTHYRTFAADFFDTLSSKRLLPSFAVGASLGGTVGGIATVVLESVAGPESLIWGWSVSLLATAAWLFRGRRSLPRWSLAVGGHELDESSVEGLRGAVRFLSRSTLSSWLVLSVIGMVFALSMLQFLSSEIFVAELGDAKSMARFFGIYLAVSNALEIGVVLFVTPRLIDRLGIATTNLVHPALTFLAFLALGVSPGMTAAIGARATREMLENALAGEVRNLSYNSLPFRFRGPLRALLEGIVFYAAMSIAGLALLLAGTDTPRVWLVGLGLAAAALYIAANWRVREAYLESLLEGLRSERLDLDQVRASLEAGEAGRVAEQWEVMAAADGETRPTRVTLELPALLAQRGALDPLVRTVNRSHPALQAACLTALAPHIGELPVEVASAMLCDALSSDAAPVRLAALRASAGLQSQTEAVAAAIVSLLNDPEARVRAQAASLAGETGRETLRRMASSRETDDALAALECLPPDLVEVALEQLDTSDPELRAAARRCATRASLPAQLEHLVREFEQPHAVVREAAVDAAAVQPDHGGLPLLTRALDDAERTVRRSAAAGLARLGEASVEPAAAALRGARLWTADAALSALSAVGSAPAAEALRRAFERSVREAWLAFASYRAVTSEEAHDQRFLRLALGDAGRRSQQIALRALDRLEEPGVVRSVLEALKTGTPRERADALEVLSNLGEREAASLLALLLEDGSLEDKLEIAGRSLALPADPEAALSVARDAEDRWLRLAYDRYIAATKSGGGPADNEEDRIMERLLALQNVPLFAHLNLDQLDAVAAFLEEQFFLAGEVVVREGDPGDHLYVLVEGEVDAVKGRGTPREHLLNTMRPPSYFGEIAVLDRSPRSATVVALTDVRVLRLAGDRLRELIHQAPEIAFEVFRVLTSRLRQADERSSAIAESRRAAPGPGD